MRCERHECTAKVIDQPVDGSAVMLRDPRIDSFDGRFGSRSCRSSSSLTRLLGADIVDLVGLDQAEVGAARTMIDRTEDRFGLKPDYLVADSAYGSAANLAWLVKEKQIAPHIPVFDKSNRTDGTFSRSDFSFDPRENRYTCPTGKLLVQFRGATRHLEPASPKQARGSIAPASTIAKPAN